MKQKLSSRLFSGTISAEQAVAECIAAITERDNDIKSFVHLRQDAALAEARALDRRHEKGPLHGVPFAVKDMIDTADLPTEYNSPLYHGFRPAKDAAVVELLRHAGAILIGKVATVEFASLGQIPETRNPFNLKHSPGGSSAGSGAAVGASLVPLALGTQTGGSTIRPAAFCAAAAMKPTYGRIPVEGVKPYAPSLDTVGIFGESAEILARTANALKIIGSAPQLGRSLNIGLYKTPYWNEASSDAQSSVMDLASRLRINGHAVTEIDGPKDAKNLNHWQDIIMHREGRASYLAEYGRNPDQLHPGFHDEVKNAKGYTDQDLCEAYDRVSALRPVIDALFSQFDAVITPATPGEAPLYGEGNGLATFNRLFTALHVPCITLPGYRGSTGLPIGVQLTGPRFSDLHLLAVASMIEPIMPVY